MSISACCSLSVLDHAGWCDECHRPCSSKSFDVGIGAYEYWGQKCVDSRIEILSDCCGAEILDIDPEPHCEHCETRVPQAELDEYGGWCRKCNDDPDVQPRSYYGQQIQDTIRN